MNVSQSVLEARLLRRPLCHLRCHLLRHSVHPRVPSRPLLTEKDWQWDLMGGGDRDCDMDNNGAEKEEYRSLSSGREGGKKYSSRATLSLQGRKVDGVAGEDAECVSDDPTSKVRETGVPESVASESSSCLYGVIAANCLSAKRNTPS